MHAHSLLQQDDAPQQRYSPVAEQPPSVVANLGYLKPTGERPYEYACEPPAGTPFVLGALAAART